MQTGPIHIGFIVHGKPKRVKRFQQALQENLANLSDLSYEVIYTKPGTAAIIARNLAEQNVSHIIAVGGDGTLGEVADGIMQTANREVIMGHLPAGTANDWMKTWSPADSMESLLKLVRKNQSQPLDTGCITFSNDEKRYFLNIADTGIGAAVIRRVNHAPKWMGAEITFFTSILRTFISYRNIKVSLESEGWGWEGHAKAVIIANGRFFGSGLAIAPEALPNDGLLDVVVIGDVSMFDYLRYLPDLKKGRPIEDERVIYKRVKKIKVQAPPESGVEADGELLGAGSITVEVRAGALQFLPPFEK